MAKPYFHICYFYYSFLFKKHSNIKKRVALVDDNGNIVKIYPSLLSAAKENKIDPHTLRDRLSGKYSSNNKNKFIHL